MARVRVLATPLGTDGAPARHLYAAQVFERENDTEPVWTCVHEHKTPVEAQLCGVQFITDRNSSRSQRGAA